ncbi:MAG: DUF4738 domain-containing protein, partial [Prevotellaceae bacterium]|nr:DUF4738 domain-containing protein [Prevotellaceae bacterium]
YRPNADIFLMPIFSKDFYKKDFNTIVPDNMLKQCILSDIVLDYIDDSGVHYNTQLALPDSPSSFIVKLTISYQGKISMHVAK